ncbi:YdeI/OmpD-associated family protein [Pedobacter jeongneungensis]|uniref:YdeI/OmpD-associated family protein n=1 Tax=Pedobacter jeongneungensis TaxID=947309 RepID=UPI00046A245B|nr:YdeI/OmpD-associated family protein [Pedobacter jeongneungensis]
MNIKKPKAFKAEIKIIGINPFVFIPEEALNYIFHQSGKDKGQLPVKMKIDGYEFKQTLVKYAGDWRLYLNTPMRKAAGKDIGDIATFEIEFDTEERTISINPKLVQALAENKQAKDVFDGLAPYLQKEIIRYIANLKTEESIDHNVKKAIQFLLGKERFIGRDGI